MWKRIKLWWLHVCLDDINKEIKACEHYIELERGIEEPYIIEQAEVELSDLRRERGNLLERMERLGKC